MDSKRDFAAWRATALFRLLLGVLTVIAYFATEDPGHGPSLAHPRVAEQFKAGW